MTLDVHTTLPAWAGLSSMSLIAPTWVEEQAEAERIAQDLCSMTGKTRDEILAAFRLSSLNIAEFADAVTSGLLEI